MPETMTSKAVQALQELVEVNIDSADGYRTAAADVRSERLATLFRDEAVRRRQFANELADLVQNQGVPPRTEGSRRARLHRWWIDLRATLEKGSEQAVLTEVDRGEDAIRERYERILAAIAGSPATELLNRQYAEIKHAHDRVRTMLTEGEENP